jgi:Protein of unknown function (DUF4127)
MSTINPTVQPPATSNPLEQNPLARDPSLDVDGASVVTNPNATLALVSPPSAEDISTGGNGPKLELEFSQTGISNSVRNNGADIVASRVTPAPNSDFAAAQPPGVQLAQANTANTPGGKPVKDDTAWTPLATTPPAPNFNGFADPAKAQAVLNDMKQDAAYNAIGPQDGKGVSGANSLWAGGATGTVVNGRDSRDLRDNATPDIYSMSPRRQTEDVPGKLLSALNTSPGFDGKGDSQLNTLVVDTHRLNQFPEQYLPEIAGAKARGQNVMVVASIGGSAGTNADFGKEMNTAQRDLRMLDNSLRMLNAAGIDSGKIQVVAGQADTPAKKLSTPAEQQQREQNVRTIRETTARDFNAIMDKNNLGSQKVNVATGLPWGGDELASTAIARALPERTVNVVTLDKDGKVVNPGTVANYWENNNATSRLINEALDKNKLRQAKPGEQADMTLYVVVDKSNGQVPYTGKPDSIRHRIEQDFADNKSKPGDTMIVDLRTNNGAFDNQILPRDRSTGKVRTDLLAVGAWGTGANSLGQTLATGKVFDAAYNPTAQRQMLVESVANDFVLRNQNGRTGMTQSPLNTALRDGGIDMNAKYKANPTDKEAKSRWDRAGSFASLEEGAKAERIVNQYVNKGIDDLFGTGVGDVTTNFQFNRVFESQFQLNGGPLPANITQGRNGP